MGGHVNQYESYSFLPSLVPGGSTCELWSVAPTCTLNSYTSATIWSTHGTIEHVGGFAHT